MHSSVDGHLDSFHVLAIVDSAVISIGKYVSFQVSRFSLGIYAGLFLMDHFGAVLSGTFLFRLQNFDSSIKIKANTEFCWEFSCESGRYSE